jgi:hypothetical protein
MITARRLPHVVVRTAVVADSNTAGESIIGVTDTTAPRNITLDDDDKIDAKRITVKDESGNAGVNNITITPESGTIDGAASVQIVVNYGVVRIYSDGSNWFSE